jgi:hypothetical protein
MFGMFEGKRSRGRPELLTSWLSRTDVRLANSQCTPTELSAEFPTGGRSGLVDGNDMMNSILVRTWGNTPCISLVTPFYLDGLASLYIDPRTHDFDDFDACLLRIARETTTKIREWKSISSSHKHIRPSIHCTSGATSCLRSYLPF